ncbi:hypothetical protein [Puniceibacterium confluentis]|uniref:hypothetical protein n=1 Tax=Puniceibacterium confluentis TaxID=1958944 RepID=UPI0016482B51|nr:hypothetical protein [Puniceibacterium confluentis]
MPEFADVCLGFVTTEGQQFVSKYGTCDEVGKVRARQVTSVGMNPFDVQRGGGTF